MHLTCFGNENGRKLSRIDFDVKVFLCGKLMVEIAIWFLRFNSSINCNICWPNTWFKFYSNKKFISSFRVNHCQGIKSFSGKISRDLCNQ